MGSKCPGDLEWIKMMMMMTISVFKRWLMMMMVTISVFKMWSMMVMRMVTIPVFKMWLMMMMMTVPQHGGHTAVPATQHQFPRGQLRSFWCHRLPKANHGEVGQYLFHVHCGQHDLHLLTFYRMNLLLVCVVLPFTNKEQKKGACDHLCDKSTCKGVN